MADPGGLSEQLVTRADTASQGTKVETLGGGSFMESIIVACITGVVTLIGVILSNSKSRAVMEVKLDALTEKVEKHNQLIERTHHLEGLSVVRNDIENLQREVG